MEQIAITSQYDIKKRRDTVYKMAGMSIVADKKIKIMGV